LSWCRYVGTLIVGTHGAACQCGGDANDQEDAAHLGMYLLKNRLNGCLTLDRLPVTAHEVG
jgi:hypothetical protein